MRLDFADQGSALRGHLGTRWLTAHHSPLLDSSELGKAQVGMAISPHSLAPRWSEPQIRRLMPAVRDVVIPMVIQTIQPAPPGPNRTDSTSHLTRLGPTGANHSDADHLPTDLAVGVRIPRGAQLNRLIGPRCRPVGLDG